MVSRYELSNIINFMLAIHVEMVFSQKRFISSLSKKKNDALCPDDIYTDIRRFVEDVCCAFNRLLA